MGSPMRPRRTSASNRSVIDVSKPDEDVGEPVSLDESSKGLVRAFLIDGSIWVLEPLESKDGKLHGRSPIYGELAIPIDGIRTLNFDAEDGKNASMFAIGLIT